MAKKVVRKTASKKSKPRASSRSGSKSRSSRSRVSRAKAPVARSRAKARPARSMSKAHNQRRNNIRIVANNLIVFFLLFLISIVLTQVFSYSLVMQNLFAIFSIAFGFISVAFLITLLIFVFLRLLRRR